MIAGEGRMDSSTAIYRPVLSESRYGVSVTESCAEVQYAENGKSHFNVAIISQNLS